MSVRIVRRYAAVSGADFTEPDGLEPPNIGGSTFEPWAHAISAPSIVDKRDNVTALKLVALQQQRKMTNSFSSSLYANDIAAPYLISCV